MYTKAETSKIKQEFWTAFGQYMKPVPSAEGNKVNWQNYKTGVKKVFFRMKAEKGFVSIGIEINHRDIVMQELLFEQFVLFKNLLHQHLAEEWQWEAKVTDEFGSPVSKIEKRMEGISVMDKNDWPSIISFLKPRIIALDAFWSDVRHGFEDFN